MVSTRPPTVYCHLKHSMVSVFSAIFLESYCITLKVLVWLCKQSLIRWIWISFMYISICHNRDNETVFVNVCMVLKKKRCLIQSGATIQFWDLVSTRCHSCDKCSQASLPRFHTLPLPCIILNANRRTKNGGSLGMRLAMEGSKLDTWGTPSCR